MVQETFCTTTSEAAALILTFDEGKRERGRRGKGETLGLIASYKQMIISFYDIDKVLLLMLLVVVVVAVVAS